MGGTGVLCNGQWCLWLVGRGMQLQKRRPFEAPFEAQGKQCEQAAALQMRYVSSAECTGRKNEEGLYSAPLCHY